KEMSGYELSEMIGHRMPEFLNEESQRYVYGLATAYLQKRMQGDCAEIGLMEVVFVCKDGKEKWVEVAAKPMFEDGQFCGYIGTTRDIDEKKVCEKQLQDALADLKIMNERLKEAAYFDSLTGAYSRRKFEDDLSAAIANRQNEGIDFALLFFDIDYFKKINDQYGHKMGDHVLVELTALLKETLGMANHLFRWGGDEFAVILPATDLAEAIKAAEKIRTTVGEHKFLDGPQITLSIGVGAYQSDETDNQLITRLDTALLSAKAKGRNSLVIC
ncbi:MAG: sensor domain-containing diguanylate cyclase, partial [Eubacteriales bacterium]|nr:sensor domain-containing diguanylate cyclase [Eubacteriales bacterium]